MPVICVIVLNNAAFMTVKTDKRTDVLAQSAVTKQRFSEAEGR